MKAKKRDKKITIEFDNKREQIELLGALGFKNISEAMASDAEQRRVPDPAEQKCPICHGEGEVFDVVTASVQECDACDGWGISNRSAGG